MQHIIKKQVIQLSLDKGLDAFHIQQKISSDYWNKIMPLLNKAFDDASTENEIICVDKIEINIGTLSEKEIEKGNWEEKVYKNITEQLIVIKHGNNKQANIQKQPKQTGISEQWIYYMRNGTLPWNVLELNEAWYKKVIESFATESGAIADLRNLLIRYPASVKRIVYQHSEGFLKSLVETLTAEDQNNLPNLIRKLISIILSFSKNKKTEKALQEKIIHQNLWEKVLVICSHTNAKLKSTEFVRLLVIQHLSKKQFGLEKVKEFLEKNKIQISESEKKTVDAGLEIIQKLSGEKPNAKSKEEIEISVDQNILIENIRELNEGIFVVNAGIVLLHPFLPMFFKNLKLLNENIFSTTSDQMKALYLLHYLATGNTRPAEHELIIPKILCSFPLGNPVINFIEINEAELAESESMLHSAIGQWDILKDTSPYGLREGFLQRKGKLFSNDEKMILQIEQNPIDILLDYLPWNLSIIKLPWRDEILRVEWRG